MNLVLISPFISESIYFEASTIGFPLCARTRE